jgi:hypothetical protein
VKTDYKEAAKKVVKLGEDSSAPLEGPPAYKIKIPLDGWELSAWKPGQDWTEDDLYNLIHDIEISLVNATCPTVPPMVEGVCWAPLATISHGSRK